jgi:hypothetical protein
LQNLCRQLTTWPDTERVLAEAGAQDALAWIRAAMQALDCDDAILTDMLDSVDRAGLSVGLDGITTRTKGYKSLPPGLTGAADGAPADVAWVCPHQRCSYVVLPGEVDSVPNCGLGPAPVPMVEVDA